MRRTSLLIVVVIALALIATGCGKSKTPATPKGKQSTPEYESVTKGDMSSYFLKATGQDSDGKKILVDEAVFHGYKGYVAIHSDANGAPGPVLGASTLLPEGDNKAISITLTQPLTADATVWPMLHLEDNNNTTYDFPNGDAPAKVNGQVVVASIKIDVT